MKKLIYDDSFITTLTSVFNDIIKDPDLMTRIPEMYEFKAVFIYKSITNINKGIRQISVSEAMLNLFHTIILKNSL